MAFVLHYTVIIAILSRVNGDSYTLRSSPVFITDYDHAQSGRSEFLANPLITLSESIFQSILEKTKEKAASVLIFVEEYFCTEDISMKDNLGTPYYHLQNSVSENIAIYYPAVMNAFKVILKVLPPQPFNIFYLGSESTKLKMFKGHRHFYIYFEDGKNETRSDALRRHDSIMQEVYFVLRKLVSGPVVAIYTGKRNPVTKHALTISAPNIDTKQKSSMLNFYSDTARYKFGG